MTEAPFDNPMQCACFTARRTARLLTQTYDEALRPLGMQVTQFSLLAVLTKAGPVRLSRLAVLMEADRTTLTRNLIVAERQGWVRTGRSDTDRRERLVEMTDLGTKALAEAMPLWREAQSHAVARLGGEDFHAFLNLSRRLRAG